jgi:2-polyprenyl-3-methyl-5-hydroxy-6-metoxy-1,4-benzoquinol methylase
MKYCFVIPVHPPKYDYVYDLLEENFIPFETFLIFTTERDYDLFERKDLLSNEKYKALILDRDCKVEVTHMTRESGIINAKKLYAVKHLHSLQMYDGIIAIDSETKFLDKEIDAESLISSVINSKFLPVQVGRPYTREIVSNAIKVFPEKYERDLINLTENMNICHWFSEGMPIYVSSYLDEFFETIGDFEKKLNFWSFDYVVFWLFLALKEYVKLEKFTSSPFDQNGFHCNNNRYSKLWCFLSEFEANKERILSSENSLIAVFTLDEKNKKKEMMNQNYSNLKSIYDKKQQFFGNGNFYQNFPTLDLPGTRDCLLRMREYRCEEFIHENDILLDIGCNTGFLSMEISKLCKFVDAYDNEPELIETAKAAQEIASIQNCNFFLQNFNYIETTENKYDAVLCLAIFEWMIKEVGIENFVDQISRITNPGARIFYESHSIEEEIQWNADKIQIDAFIEKGYRVLHTQTFTDDCQRKITVLEK